MLVPPIFRATHVTYNEAVNKDKSITIMSQYHNLQNLSEWCFAGIEVSTLENCSNSIMVLLILLL